MPVKVDIHQHVWTTPLLDALAERECLPFVRRDDGLTVLHCGGELPYVIDTDGESPDRRAQLLRADGIDLAVVALSSPIGVEALPREASSKLIHAHLDGVLALGDGFAAWGPIPVDRPDPADVDNVLNRGCIGVSVPACALAGRDRLEALRPALERAESRDVPVFVHPGGVATRDAREAPLNEPLWWRALTDYVSQMQAAWLTFATHGRRELPHLRVVFAMLAGGGPLLDERLATRGGPSVELRDPLTFYDTSSYGPRMIETMGRWVGPSQLVYGSDRPVVEPEATAVDQQLMSNSARLVPTTSAASATSTTTTASGAPA
jgi:predicted TIM-barrel fold metal-dependent hydrolase